MHRESPAYPYLTKIHQKVQQLAAEGKTSHEIYRLLAEHGHDPQLVKRILEQRYHERSLFQRIRFSLILVVILYPLILALYVNYSGAFYFAELSTILAVFSIPVVSAFLLEVAPPASPPGFGERFWIETLFGALATLIFVIVHTVFAIPLHAQEILTLFMVMLVLHYFISLLLHIRKTSSQPLRDHLVAVSSQQFTTPLLAFEFRLDHYVRRIGSLHLIAAIVLIIFVGLFFGRLREAFIFVMIFILVLKALEGVMVVKSDLLLYIMLAGMGILSLVGVFYFQSFFSLLVLVSLVLTLAMTFGHRGILALPVHFLNAFLAILYCATALLLFFGLFAVLENLFALSQSIPPVLIVLLVSGMVILACIMLYYLLFSFTLRSIGTLSIAKIVWPFSLLVAPRGSPQKDAVIFGIILGLSILIIVTLVLILL